MDRFEQERHDDFLRLYLPNEDALRGFVRSLVPTQADAQEVMQDIAAVLWRKFQDISNSQDFRRWSFGVARFEALTFLRAARRDRHVFGEEAIKLIAQEAEESADLFDAERTALNECLKKLPETQRALVVAAYVPGVRIDELATQSGRSPMSLYKSLHRIRIALMECTQNAIARGEMA